MNTQQQNYCGIDVAKRSFVMGITHQKKTKTETNNAKGIKYAIEYLNKFDIRLIVIESTGGLEIPLAKALQRDGFRVVIANPRQTNYFAQSQSLAKTDPKDAKMLAAYAQMIDSKDDIEDLLYTPPTEAQELLEALVTRRTQLVEMRVAEKNRLQQVHHSQRASVQQLIDTLSEMIADLDGDIDNQSKHFNDKVELIKDIKGVGKNLIATLMSMLPELGTISHKKIASLVGVAPHPKESGTMKFKSRCRGGRTAVRNALYMAAMSTIRFEPKFKAFYERLISKGKTFKVAINACMHKLLTVLNAIVKHNKKWDATRHLSC